MDFSKRCPLAKKSCAKGIQLMKVIYVDDEQIALDEFMRKHALDYQ